MTTSRPLRTAALAALPAAALAAVHCAPVVSTFGPLRNRTMPRLSGHGRADHVALTFDDVPDPLSTPFFLRLLDERGVRATFFLLGSEAHRSPGVVREIAAAGHEIGVHGWRHRPLLLRGPRATTTTSPAPAARSPTSPAPGRRSSTRRTASCPPPPTWQPGASNSPPCRGPAGARTGPRGPHPSRSTAR
ncbi:polysaccharide deacetylase family protein [Streptomyces sp. NPDC001984]|uniref:polysaccharide deacetylase family protein n=1 Tax=Streptomyces sp. NPDC002619 TaxID=3364655 RepID=UPI00368BCC66